MSEQPSDDDLKKEAETALHNIVDSALTDSGLHQSLSKFVESLTIKITEFVSGQYEPRIRLLLEINSGLTYQIKALQELHKLKTQNARSTDHTPSGN